MSKREDEILGHDYDGIREYDNQLPGWWLFIFYGSMVWALVYALFYHFGPGLLETQRHEAEMSRLRVEAARAAIHAGDPTDEAVLAVAGSPEHLVHGRRLFAERCAECHGPNGGGGIGPNLTDNHWLDGGSPSEIHATIRDGVHLEGMPGWSWSLRPDEIWLAAAFVESLRGSDVPNGKPPEGERWQPGSPSASRRAALTATLQAVVADAAALERGREIYLGRCLPCHGPEGGGLIGPNLTDEHAIHGGGLADIFRVVSEGVPEKGMVPWANQLSRQELQEVTAFVASLWGRMLPGRPPEGEPWGPETASVDTPGSEL